MTNRLLPQNQPYVTRRGALRMLLGASTLVGVATGVTPAYADTEADLAAAQARYDEAQRQLSDLAGEYEELSRLQANTLDEIEDISSRIAELEGEIDERTADLEEKRTKLSATVSEQYKDGSHGVIDLVLGSKSIEELISGVRSYDKITESTSELIDTVKAERAQLESDQQQLEEHKSELEAQRVTQDEQLSQMRDKQAEAQDLVDGLDQEVKDLMAQRDAELLAAQEEAKRATEEREAQESAAQEQAEVETQETQASTEDAASASDTSGTASAGEGDGSDAAAAEEDTSQAEEAEASADAAEAEEVASSSQTATGSAAAVVASCKSTPSPGAGLCAAWVSNVFTNAGFGFVGGNANDMYNNYATYSSRSDLKPGMIVAVSTHPHTSAGRIYGHIGIYIGGGQLMENVGSIRTSTIDWWCSYYGATVTPRWGWLGGIVLS